MPANHPRTGVRRLSAMDASFLQIETPTNRMHLLALFVFEGPAPSISQFRAAVAARLPLVPRFRQRLAEVPLGLGRPVWVDDETFELCFHTRHTSLPIADWEEFRALADQLFAQPLDMSRPLWEMCLVEGLPEGRFAVASKFHHCMVDGVSATDLSAKLFTAEPVAETAVERWIPQPEPSNAALAVDALAGAARLPPVGARWLLRRVHRPRALLSAALARVDSVARLGSGGLAPPSPLNRGRSSSSRRTHWHRVPLGEMREAKTAYGTTINNVVLAAVTGALDRYFARHGETVPAGFRAAVPVSVRVEPDKGVLGNRVALMYPRLPGGIGDPVARIDAVDAEIRRSRESRQAVGAKTITDIGDFAPPTIMAQVFRLTARARMFNLVITNVPGPQVRLHLCGRPLVEVLPTVPVTPVHALAVGVISYMDTMFFGVTTDPRRIPDGELFVAELAAALRELYERRPARLTDAVLLDEPAGPADRVARRW
jgi:diacylglycerol O-acyltransferase / wax synthase